MSKKEYKNVTKTKNSIRNALIDIFTEGETVSSISIIELCGKANITRGTFYNHYKSTKEVAYEIKSKFMEEFREVLMNADFSDEGRYEFYKKCGNYFENHKKIIIAITRSLSYKSILDIKEEIIETIFEIIKEKLPNLISETNKDLSPKLRLFANGVLISYIDSVLGNTSYTIQEFTEIAYKASRSFLHNRK
jgi:AcrR family transcriptional regulator